MLANTLSWIRSLLFTIPVLFLATIGFGTLAVAGSLFVRTPRFPQRCARLWARTILAAGFVRIMARGLEQLDPAQPYVLCSNHLSYLDPPVLLACLPVGYRFLAKKPLFRIPFLGWGMKRCGHIPIDRANARAAARSLAKAADELRQGVAFVIFPEGSRSLDGELQPFLSGGFRLALEAQAPVVPLAIWGTRTALAPGSINLHGGLVELLVGAPISTAGMTVKEKHRLAGQVQQTVATLLDEISRPAGQLPGVNRR